MSSIFGITEEKMQETSSNWTVKEIYQQPATWEKTFRSLSTRLSHRRISM